MDLHEVLLASRMAGKNNGNGESVDLSDYYTKSQTNSLISGKVDKVTGKGLSENDFTTVEKDKLKSLENYDDSQIKSDISAINSTLGNKVDKVTGKGLSTNDFTDEYKSKVDTSAPQSTTYTKNETDNLLGDKVDKVSGKGLSTNDFTKSYKDKLDGLKNYDDTELKEDVSEAMKQAAINQSTLGYECKNLCYNYAASKKSGSITATVNSDSSITFTGKNSLSSSYITMYHNLLNPDDTKVTAVTNYLTNGKYIISGFSSKVYGDLILRNSAEEIIFSTHVYSGETIFEISSLVKYITFKVIVAPGADFTNNPVTIYPMIRRAEITDDTYEPYRPSVAEYIASLEERIAALEGRT